MSVYVESAHTRALESTRRKKVREREAVPRVYCECCDGTGERKLGIAYAETWLLLTNEWQTTTKINKSLPRVKQTALVNRLTTLWGLGIAEVRVDPSNYRRREWKQCKP